MTDRNVPLDMHGQRLKTRQASWFSGHNIACLVSENGEAAGGDAYNDRGGLLQ